MYQSSSVIIEDVHGTALVSTGCQLSIPTEVDGHAEAACDRTTSGLVGLYFFTSLKIPNTDLTIVRCARKVPLIKAECESPNVAIVGQLQWYFP